MSDDIVEIVRGIYAHWARGEMWAGADAFDRDVVFESFMPDSSERVVCRGLDEVAAFLREFLAQWRKYRLIGEEFERIGSDKVLVRGRQTATGRQSGVDVESPMFTLWTFASAKVVGLVLEPQLDAILEAAGRPR